MREAIAGIESGGKYGIMGGSGGHFAGRYQMGMIGHPEVADTARSLGEPVPSQAQFLGDKTMQERFFERYTLNHHRWLMANSPEYAKASAEEKLKALGYAHNQGAAGAAKWLRGGPEGRDAFGTSGTLYSRAIASKLAAVGSGKKSVYDTSRPHEKQSDEAERQYIEDNNNRQKANQALQQHSMLIPYVGARLAANAYNTHNNSTINNASSHTQVGNVIVHTPATDASGIVRDIKPAIERTSFAMQANYSLA